MNQWNAILDKELSVKAMSIHRAIAQTVSRQMEVEDKLDLLMGKPAQLLFLSHCPEMSERVQVYLKDLFNDIENNPKMDGGLMTGLAGIGYVLKLILDKTNALHPDILNDFFPVIRKFTISSIQQRLFDFMYGYLGQCYFLLEENKCNENLELFTEATRVLKLQAIPQEKGIGWITHWDLKLVGDSIDKSNPNCANLGMAHGVPGIVYILVKLRSAYPELEIDSLIEDALQCLLSEESEENKAESGFYYPIYSGAMRKSLPSQLSWCYSDLSISIMFYNLWSITGQVDFKERADKLAASCAEIRAHQLPTMCSGLCHGAAGIAHMFNKIYHITKNDFYKEIARYWFSFLFDELLITDDNGFIQALNFDKRTRARKLSHDHGFLEGLSGIGLSIHTAVYGGYTGWDKLLLL